MTLPDPTALEAQPEGLRSLKRTRMKPPRERSALWEVLKLTSVPVPVPVPVPVVASATVTLSAVALHAVPTAAQPLAMLVATRMKAPLPKLPKPAAGANLLSTVTRQLRGDLQSRQ